MADPGRREQRPRRREHRVGCHDRPRRRRPNRPRLRGSGARRVEEDHRRTRCEGTEHGDVQVDAGADRHEHAVAGAHSQGAQLFFSRVGQRAQVGKAQAAAIRQVYEGPIGRLSQPAIQQLMNARCHVNRR
ncbi:MAG: hypothetical protein BWZ09_02782 [Alphaproteobacteria bacterium ADurb.BinA305]|nr:MAG: hypothetical protein BWZ09_02782 [Alphaproteobacteria bacterium ADurb.BinA305]